ncbi:MAG: hypothetical protein WD716_04360 [Fimbriimonadaceae bacterium]
MDELPFALTHPEAVPHMQDAEQARHLWEALQYVLLLKSERTNGARPPTTGVQEDGTYVPTDEDLDRNVPALQYAIGKLAHQIKLRLREEGAWKDLAAPHWPSNYAGDDPDHMYKSGAYPPVLMVWPPADQSWADLDKPTRLRLHKELAVWGETAAGRATLPKERVDEFIEVIARAQDASDKVRTARLELEMAVLCAELSSTDPERWQ